ncbi:arsenic resistance N-acetyltransferase ArsN2 [Spirosoma flavum]|uniref:Arsenic resistance N-acetyltransferase ArsN2 n=1 Tax=Spirosoma flavum TaxID=2048557 RepID=A0ABW6AUN1_9BACT
MTIHLQAARLDDHPQVIALLKQANLVTEDWPPTLTGFWLAFDGLTLIGSAGIEPLGTDGLLRSVAVRPSYQSQHIARQLIEKLVQQARQQGLATLYLITTTADAYFARLGFTAVERAQVPDSITRTPQFDGLCPVSAIVMKRNLIVN